MKKAEENVTPAVEHVRQEESDARFRTVFEGSPDAIFVEDRAGNILDVNPAACTLHKASREDLIGKNVLSLVPQEHRDRVSEDFKKWGTGELSYYEGFSVAIDGTRTPVEIRCSQIQYMNQDALLFHVHDISRRKKAEREHLELREQLGRAKRMESLGLLAGRVAHDLNNILGPLVAYPEFILEELPEANPIRSDVEQIQIAARRAAAIIRDLLDLSRRGVYEQAAVDMAALIHTYMDNVEYRELCRWRPHVNVHVDPPKTDAIALGSTTHLGRVLANLISNAFEAVDEEEGEISIGLTHATFTTMHMGYEVVDPGSYVVLSVSDNGSGIDPEDMESIMEPFFTRKSMERGGTGLGLSVVYGIVKDLHGFIDIESRLGEGTVFSIYLPATTSAAPAEATSTESQCRGAESVLIIDDDEAIRVLSSRLLSDLGYNVCQAMHGHEAVDIMKERAFDIIVLDMVMEEGFDGLDTYKEILKTHPSQPCIIASGFSIGAKVKEAQSLGAGEFISKPYDKETLGRAVRKEIDRHL